MAAEMTTERKRTEASAAATAANPNTDGAEYLLAKGWKCLGNPAWESSLWLDPTQPLLPYYSEEKCMVDTPVRDNYVDSVTGERKVRYKLEQRQILAQDGTGGALQGAVRQIFHPAVQPILMPHALKTQVERDAMEQTRQMAEAEERKRK